MREGIVILSAMGREVHPLLGRLQGVGRCDLAHLRGWRGTIGDRGVLVFPSGMGPTHARRAAEAVLERFRPQCLLSVGFAGAVRPGLIPGDLVLGARIFAFDGNRALPVAAPTLLTDAPILSPPWVTGTILTTGEIVPKGVAASRIPADLSHPVLDMETAAVAQVAGDYGTPLIALRAISDPADEELAFSLSECCDRNRNLRTWRILLAAVQRPAMIPQLFRLAKNSRVAARSLAAGVVGMLSSPHRGAAFAGERGKSRR